MGGPGGTPPGRGFNTPGRGAPRRPRRPHPTTPAIPRREQALRFAKAMPGLIKHLPHHRPWMVTLLTIATVVVLGTCGFGGYLLVRDDNTVVGAEPNATPTAAERNIDSRKTDPKPLTANDVFPNAEIVADPSIPPYKRLGKPQVATNCRLAATAEIGSLLISAGCNQVVRATFLSPDRTFILTAGVLNLNDSAAALNAHSKLSKMISPTSRLTGYIPPTEASAKILGKAPTNLAFYVQGHFLLYSVIARVDGKDIATDDPHLKVMVYDILETYLRDTVIENWKQEHTQPPAG